MDFDKRLPHTVVCDVETRGIRFVQGGRGFDANGACLGIVDEFNRIVDLKPKPRTISKDSPLDTPV